MACGTIRGGDGQVTEVVVAGGRSRTCWPPPYGTATSTSMVEIFDVERGNWRKGKQKLG